MNIPIDSDVYLQLSREQIDNISSIRIIECWRLIPRDEFLAQTQELWDDLSDSISVVR